MGKSDSETKAFREKIVCENYGGILPQFEAFYIHSIIYPASRSVEAFERYENATSAQKIDAFYAVSSVHEALSHAASLSRFFWPSRNKGVAPHRAQKLRRAFTITEDSPLKDRKLRDALEHYDERLDTFLIKYPVGYFFPQVMIGESELTDDPIGQIFKLVDPRNSCFVILGEKYYFDSVRQEIERVLCLAINMNKNGCRLRKETDKASLS